MPEKTITKCDRCGAGNFFQENFESCKGLVEDGPLGYGARMIYSEKEGKEWGSPKVLILCRECLEKLLPIIKNR